MGRNQISENELKQELNRIAEKYRNGDSPQHSDMKEYGEYSPSTYRDRFNSWSEALEYFGFVPNKKKSGITKEELLEDLLKISKKNEVPIPPRGKDIDKFSKYSHGTYENYFGNIGNAVEELGMKPRRSGKGKDHWCWKGGEYKSYYGPSWHSQRLKAWKRADYKCSICGDTNSGKLKRPDIHHIKPSVKWNVEENHEEMNDLDNLVSLCRICHREFEGMWEDCDRDEFIRNAKRTKDINTAKSS